MTTHLGRITVRDSGEYDDSGFKLILGSCMIEPGKSPYGALIPGMVYAIFHDDAISNAYGTELILHPLGYSQIPVTPEDDGICWAEELDYIVSYNKHLLAKGEEHPEEDSFLHKLMRVPPRPSGIQKLISDASYAVDLSTRSDEAKSQAETKIEELCQLLGNNADVARLRTLLRFFTWKDNHVGNTED